MNAANFKIKLVESDNREELGKYFLKKGISFLIKGELGKAYSFIIEGLEFITCDCKRGDWYDEFEGKDFLFNEIVVESCTKLEFLFLKAFLFSYYEDKKRLYIGLDAIEKYIKENFDYELGYYVQGKIYLGLDDPAKALDSFKKSQSKSPSYRTSYRIGRTKEQLLKQKGIDNLFQSFLSNPSSACCGRVLQKCSRSNHEIILPSEEDNPLILSFNEEVDEWKFQKKLEDYSKTALTNGVKSSFEKNDLLQKFILLLQSNSSLFLQRVEEDVSEEDDYESEYYDDHDDYDDPYRNYGRSYDQYGGGPTGELSDDFINDVLDGNPDAYWNID